MAVHNMAIFWRDSQARQLTMIHFQLRASERATVRARKLLNAFMQLSALQAYGAALDDDPLPIEATRPAPAVGTDVRAIFHLVPDIDRINPRAGEGYLKFSIPGPVTDVLEIAETKKFYGSAGEILEREIIPYLCLPKGIKAKLPPKLFLAAPEFLDEEKRPQPGQSPLAAAINVTQADVDKAKQALGKALNEAAKNPANDNTPHLRGRLQRYQTHLDHLYTWDYIEKTCFTNIDSLPLTMPALPSPARELPAANAQEQIISIDRKDREQRKQPPTTLISPAPALNLVGQVLANNEKILSKSTGDTFMPSTPAAPADHLLPAPPDAATAHLWSDVPPIHFSDPAMWYTRDKLKEVYQISERSYYRWLDKLKKYGLQRELSKITTEGKTKCYYRPDVERAVAQLTIHEPKMRAVKALREVPPATPTMATGAAILPPQVTAMAVPNLAATPAAAAATPPFTVTAPGVPAASAAQAASLSAQAGHDQAALISYIQILDRRLQQALSQLEQQERVTASLQQQLDALRSTVADTTPDPQPKKASKAPADRAESKKIFSLLENISKQLQDLHAQKITSPKPSKTPAPAQSRKHKHLPTPPKQAEHSLHANAEALSVSQAAKLLNKDAATIRRWCESGKLKAKKIKGVWAIDRLALKLT